MNNQVYVLCNIANLRGQVLYERSGYERLGVHGDYMEYRSIRKFANQNLFITLINNSLLNFCFCTLRCR